MTARANSAIIKFQAFYRGLMNSLRVFPHAWKASPSALSVLGVLVVLQGLVPPFSALMLGESIQAVQARSSLWPVILGWALLALAEFGFSPIVFSVSGRLNEDLTFYLQKVIREKAMRFDSLEIFEQSELHDRISIIARESASRPVNYIVLFTYLIRGAVSVIGLIVVLSSVSVLAALATVLIGFPLARGLIIMRSHNWSMLRGRMKEARYLEYLTNLSVDRHAARDLRVFGGAEFLRGVYNTACCGLASGLRTGRRRSVIAVIPYAFCGVVGYSLIVAWLLISLKNQSLQAQSAGGVAVVLQSFVALQAAIFAQMENVGYMSEKAHYYKELDDFLAMPESASAASQGAVLDQDDAPVNFPVRIEFQDVSFSYPGAPELALDRVSFEIPPRETVFLVGANGSGKSTVLKLLAGFYEPCSGQILVDGVPLSSLERRSWWNAVTLVAQDFRIYAASVSDNVRMGMAVSEKKVSEALVKAFGESSSLDSASMVGKEFGGIALSGGEEQRIAIARAAVKQAAVVLLDEPTSAIDPIREAELFGELTELTCGRSSLVVTHRLGMVQSESLVIVLGNGQVLQSGRAHDLLAISGPFSVMVQRQSNAFPASAGVPFEKS